MLLKSVNILLPTNSWLTDIVKRGSSTVNACWFWWNDEEHLCGTGECICWFCFQILWSAIAAISGYHIHMWILAREIFVEYTYIIYWCFLYVQSNFAPIDELGEAVVVSTIEGAIPNNFPQGVYIRNGKPCQVIIKIIFLYIM